MKRRFCISLALAALLTIRATAEQRAIVRVAGTQAILSTACSLLGCTIVRGLDDPLGQLFLIGISDTASISRLLSSLSVYPGILNAEVDSVMRVAQDRPPVPPALYDTINVPFYGVQVHSGYLSQPAVSIVRLADARNMFGLSGNSAVAVIDTGVDPTHPVLQGVLAAGYDFTHNRSSG